MFLLAWLSRFIAGNAGPVDWGIEYVVFALAIGLSISNFFTLPEWFMEAVRTEYYIKSGLVVLGAGLLFFEIVQAGFLGVRTLVGSATVGSTASKPPRGGGYGGSAPPPSSA